MSVLLAYVMLLAPGVMDSVARADTLYTGICSTNWATGGTATGYDYDANGSMITKTSWTGLVDTGTQTEQIDYTYNLQNRLSRVVTDSDPASSTNNVDVVDYAYNSSGIRVEKYSFTVTQNYLNDAGEQTNAISKVTTCYLIDSANHTGYAQVFEELSFNKADPVIGTDTADSVIVYTIGDDVIAQDVDGTSKYLLYDGHGSTRQGELKGSDPIFYLPPVCPLLFVH